MHSTHRGFALLVPVFVVASVAIVACSGDDGQPSTGSSSGTTTGSSGSSGSSGEDADGGSEGGAGGKKKNADVGCAKDDECESGVCFIGGSQSFCSVKCTPDNASTVCVQPFTGSCNKQGYCKRD